jgi:hypothetical protein
LDVSTRFDTDSDPGEGVSDLQPENRAVNRKIMADKRNKCCFSGRYMFSSLKIKENGFYYQELLWFL